MNETAVDTLEAAVSLDRIDGAEDIFGADGEDHTLSVVLARVDDPDHLSVIVEHRSAAISRICCDGQLKGGSVFPMAGCSAKIPFVINNLRAGVTKCKELFAKVTVRFANAIWQANEGAVCGVVDLQKCEICLGVKSDKPGVIVSKGVLDIDLSGISNHVRVGNQIALTVNEETRAEAVENGGFLGIDLIGDIVDLAF